MSMADHARLEAEEEIATLRARVTAVELAYRYAALERDEYAANLTATQMRCTELLMQVRDLKALLKEKSK